MFPAIKGKTHISFLLKMWEGGLSNASIDQAPSLLSIYKIAQKKMVSSLNNPNPSINYGDANDLYLHKPTWHVFKHFPFSILFLIFSTSALRL